MSNEKPQRKTLPALRSDEEAERFVEEAGLAEYDLSAMQPVRFESRKGSADETAHAGEHGRGAEEAGRKARRTLPATDRRRRGAGFGRGGG
ncbi:MAG: CopG family antitoxin [Beijerinckiaceae bacterium]